MSKTQAVPTAKELRKRAKELNIEGWGDMSREELADAIAAQEGDTTSTTKADKTAKVGGKEKKAIPKKATTATTTSSSSDEAKPKKERAKAAKDPSNPYRAGTNLWHITEALKVGGRRSELVEKLKPVLEFNPRKKTKKDFDVAVEIDRRLKVIGYLLKNDHGWTMKHDGRGSDAFIQVTPPSAKATSTAETDEGTKPSKPKRAKK